ncbi:MAG: DUF1273 family protein [Actinobacteria bacterium]|nr:DUF1273 family protein [Actinomycetota bacterium]
MSDERHPDATVVYTDGACINNPGPGGWAWAVPGGAHRSGYEAATTNQRMELTAAFEALLHIAGPVHVVSDSTYVVNCFRNRWYEGWLKRGWLNAQKQPVANQDLWKPFIELYLSREAEVSFAWVKGHSGDEMNDIVDRLATEAARTQSAREGDAPPTDLGEPDETFGASDSCDTNDEIGRAGAISSAASAGSNRSATGPLSGFTVAVFGHRPPQLGGYDEDNPIAVAVRRRLGEVIDGLNRVHDDLTIATGLGLGAEQLAAEVAAELGVPYVAVLAFPDPDRVWPRPSRERFARLLDGARATSTRTPKAPDTKQAAGKAVGDRDRWLAAHADAAIVVWDGQDRNLGQLVDELERRDVEFHLVTPPTG